MTTNLNIHKMMRHSHFIIALCMLFTLGVGQVFATDDTYDFNTAGITKVSGPNGGDQTSSSTDVVFKSKTGNTTDSWTIEFTGDTYYSYGTNNGVHFGKNAAAPHATLTSKSYSGVTNVSIVSTQGNASVTIAVSVGGTSFGSSTSGTNTNHSFSHAAASGAVSISIESNTNGRFQINSITITTASGYTVDFAVNNSDYGSVSPSSQLTGITSGTTITTSSNTVTVNGTTVTATPHAQDANYNYAFSSWSVTDNLTTVTKNVTITANFTRTARSFSNYTTNCVSTRTIYLDAYHFGDSDGAKFAIYSWKDGSDPLDDKLADAFMTKETDCALPHLYVGEYPDNHDRIIFLRNAAAAASPVKSGANKLNQTSNITTDADKDLFTIASGGGGDTYTGSWSVYTKKYAVTFDKNGISSTSTWPSDQCKASGEKVTDPNVTPLAMGKTFVGWYQEAEGTNAWVFNENTVSAATTIYAKWNNVATRTIYLDCSAVLSGQSTWDGGNAVLFARVSLGGIIQDIQMGSYVSSCDNHVYAFTIPGNSAYVKFFRCANGATSVIEGGSGNVWNQTGDTELANNKDWFTITDWGSVTYQSSAFTPVSYTISYNAGTNGTGSRANDSKACGVAFTLPNSQVFTRNGYTMDGWATSDGGDKSYNLGGSYTTDANLNLYPHWREATYTVTLTTNGGTINAGNVENYTYGTGATLPTNVTKDHATFQGWYASSTFEGDRVYTIGTTEYGNKQYYAKWEDIKWTVTWKANGETFHTDNNVVDGNTLSAPTPAPGNLTTGSNGCDAEFVGWVLEDNDPGALSISSQSSTPSGLFTTTSPAITANTTFVAIYRQEQ